MSKTTKEQLPLRIGISTCLLGESVRFDGGHKKDRYLTDVLGKYFEWVSVCPELEVGMGIPREPVRLVNDQDAVSMVGVSTGKDWTEPMRKFSDKRIAEIGQLQLSGYIFKSDSPSCGIERVRVYSPKGMPAKNGKGLFAEQFMASFPLIPVEEEGRLNDDRLRENFIVRVFAYHRLQTLMTVQFSIGALVRFHTIHKYLMLAHSPKHYEQLGPVVANAKKTPVSVLKETYSALFMEGLKIKTTAQKNVNVLHHILGFMKEFLSAGEKASLLETIDDYHRELIPLVVPLTLVKHYIDKHKVEYIRDQIYVNPHPKELMLRNHV